MVERGKFIVCQRGHAFVLQALSSDLRLKGIHLDYRGGGKKVQPIMLNSTDI